MVADLAFNIGLFFEETVHSGFDVVHCFKFGVVRVEKVSVDFVDENFIV